MRTGRSTAVLYCFVLGCCLFGRGAEGEAAAGWQRSGSSPFVQTNTPSLTIVESAESKNYAAFLSAGCLPDGLLIMLKVPTLAGPKLQAPIQYRVTYAVDASEHHIIVDIEKPDEFVRLRREDAKLFFKNIADGTELSLVAETEARKLQASFDISGFFEVVIPALSSCL